MLVDTESWYFDATKRALEGVGVTLMMDQYLDFMARGQSAWDLACIIHEQATAAADSNKNTGRAPSGCSAVCKANCKATRKRVATCCRCTRPSQWDGTRALQSAHPACEARRCTTLAVCFANCLAIRLRIALDPTSLRFFMNNPG